MTSIKVCSVTNCGRSCYSRGLCKPHYAKQYYQSNTEQSKAMMSNFVFDETP